MAFPEELLELAQELAELHPETAHQASLRRAVSTAYYALFHLLISEATANWARPELRAILGRCFDHGTMKSASEKKVSDINTELKQNPSESAKNTIAIHLRTVAKAFIQAQQRRNDADYNLKKEWTHVDVDIQIVEVQDAFHAWSTIREEPIAQAYLVSLLGPKEHRSNEPAGQSKRLGKKARPASRETPSTG